MLAGFADGMHETNLVDVKNRLWEGCLNVRVVCSSSESEEIEYLFAGLRNSYIPLYIQSIVKYFSNFIPELGDGLPVWLEYAGVPLKWHLPIGVLYDFLHIPSLIDHDYKLANEWVLVLKYSREYPSEIIPFYYQSDTQEPDYMRSLKEVVVNQLKQSCFVMNGNSKKIMNLSEENSNDLWTSIVKHNLRVYTGINKKIVPTLNKIQRLPIKILIPGTGIMIQAPIYPKDFVTLKDMLSEQLPKPIKSNYKTYIQGVELNTDIPLIDVWELFKHLDNFLYIIIIIT